MNYYPFHIGDYATATRHLSWDEDMAYRRLLDVYYTTEKPLPNDLRSVWRLTLASTDEHRDAIKIVLEEFFVLAEEGWVNTRADKEIAAMQEKQQRQRDRANKRWDKQRSDTPIDAAIPDQAMPQHTKSDATASKTDASALPPTPTPTPTPTPIFNTPQSPPEENYSGIAGGDKNVVDFQPSMASAICIALRSEGIGSANSSNPELLALIAKGADIGMFVHAAKCAKGQSSAFPYVLTVVKNQLKRAQQIADSPIAQTASYETPYQRAARERVAELAPGIARKAPGQEISFTNFVDEVTDVIAIESNRTAV